MYCDPTAATSLVVANYLAVVEEPCGTHCEMEDRINVDAYLTVVARNNQLVRCAKNTSEYQCQSEICSFTRLLGDAASKLESYTCKSSRFYDIRVSDDNISILILRQV